MPTNPLTPTEHAEVNAALETVKAEFDGERLKLVEFCDRMKLSFCRWNDWATRNEMSGLSAEYVESAQARKLAAELLASQMAGRLARVTQ